MSARGPLGVSARPDLFTPRDQVSARAQAVKQVELQAARGAGAVGEGEDRDHESPLVLERVLGYSALPQGLLCHPADEDLFVKSMGALVAVESLSNPRLQSLLRAHDAPVSALAVSGSGALLASGQRASARGPALVVLWRLFSCSRLAALPGLTGQVTTLAFSPDERFLLGCDKDCALVVWDLRSGEIVCSHRSPAPVTVALWTDAADGYRLCWGAAGLLSEGALAMSKARMQWQLRVTPFGVPPAAGIVRVFRCMALSGDGQSVLVGTAGGELLCFKLSSLVYRSCTAVCSNGVNAVAVAGALVVCGGGDGRLVLMQGGEFDMRSAGATQLEGGVASLSVARGGAAVLVGMLSGRVLRVLLADLSALPVSTAPTDCALALCMASAAPAHRRLLSGSDEGALRLWDLVQGACLCTARVQRSGRVTALLAADMADTQLVLAAFEDGFVRCFDARLGQLWGIPGAHRRGTSCLSAHTADAQYLVSGGGDGVVRVWLLRNRELVTQFTEHRGEVCAVLVDARQPHIIHSAAANGAVISFDLKSGRRLIGHDAMGGSSVTCMAQRTDSERELVVADTRGRIVQLDVDVREPVSVLDSGARTAIRCCAVSPSGLFLAFAGDDGLLKLLLLATGEVVCYGRGHSEAVCSVVWTSDERQIVTGALDACMCVWNFNIR